MLKRVLIANAISCLVFGSLFVAAARPVATFLGQVQVWALVVLGIGLILNGAHILLVARKPYISRGAVMYFAIGDASWVMATVVLLTTDAWINGPTASLAAIIVATWVGACGFLQWKNAPAA